MKKVYALLVFSCLFSQIFSQTSAGNDIVQLFGNPGGICITGNNTSLSIAADINQVSGTVFYQWTTSDGFSLTGTTSGNTSSDVIVGITVNPGSATASTTPRTITFEISDDNNFTNGDDYSESFSITVNTLPDASIGTPDGTQVCSSGSPSIALNGGIANTAHSISSWQWSGGSSSTSQSITTTSAAAFNLVATNTCGTDASAASVTTTTATAPSIATQPVNQPTSGSTCIGDNATFSVTANGTSPTYTWQKKAPSDGTFSATGGNTSSDTRTATNSAGAYPDQTQFRVLIEVAACPENDVVSNSAILSVTSNVDIDGSLPSGVSLTAGGTYTYVMTVNNASSAGTTLVWNVDGTNYSDANGFTSGSSTFSGVDLGSGNTVDLVITQTISSSVATATCQITNPNDGTPQTSQSISLTATGPCSNEAVSAFFEALPIELKHFRGADMGDYVELNWATLSEINNDFFAVERSWDGEQFQELTQIKGAGDSYQEQSYSWKDADAKKQAPEATVYYRLRQTDFDGATSFSNVISLPLEKRPVFDIIELVEMEGELEISFSTNSANEVSARVYDLDGRLLNQTEVSPEEGFNSLTINTSALNSGIYVLVLVNGEQVVTRKFARI